MTSLLFMTVATLIAPAATDEDMLAQARQRIERVRMGEVTVRVIEDNQPLPEGTELYIEQTRHAFLFGANNFVLGKFATPEQNAAYESAFSGLFNYATLPFYWWEYEPAPGKLQDARTLELVKWAGNRITCKGHPLAWNWIDPAWLAADPLEAMKQQFERIEKTTRQWDGQIVYWDVVNEATAFDREEPRKSAPKLTEAISKIGVQSYLRQAFEAARRGNPKARLVINDYVTSPDFAHKVLDKLVDDKGRPMNDIIGLQCHQHGGAWSAQQIWEMCERFAKYGKPLHFTEATILSGEHGWELPTTRPAFKWESTPAGEAQQAREVVRFYTMLFSHPAVEAITWWDPCDQHAWQAAPAGLLRRDVTPKPAYDALLKLVKGAWWTKTRVKAGKDGVVKFRGFYGDYEMRRVMMVNRPMSAPFSFTRETKEPLTVNLFFYP